MDTVALNCNVGTHSSRKICYVKLCCEGYVWVCAVPLLILFTSCFMTKMLILCPSGSMDSVLFAHLILLLSILVIIFAEEYAVWGAANVTYLYLLHLLPWERLQNYICYVSLNCRRYPWYLDIVTGRNEITHKINDIEAQENSTAIPTVHEFWCCVVQNVLNRQLLLRMITNLCLVQSATYRPSPGSKVHI